MDVPWSITLRPDQRTNPVTDHRSLILPAIIRTPTDEELLTVFPEPNKHSLKTWGREPGVVAGTDPHWIGVCKNTSLHTDPMYPRYTHHLLLRVDDFCLRGIDKAEHPLRRGSYVRVDTHSPHQLYGRTKGARWYCGVSIDSPEPLDASAVLPKLIAYARDAEIITPEIAAPNNGGRFAVKKASE